jgi:hypothetical protein
MEAHQPAAKRRFHNSTLEQLTADLQRLAQIPIRTNHVDP